MMVTLVATCGVSAILAGVLVALGMIERRLAPEGSQALDAAGLNWPVCSRSGRNADAPFVGGRRSGRMRQIITGSSAIPLPTNRSNKGN